ncbi:MAG: hypothetical protein JJU36_15145 [Phycisphaeraceae bacterium]|nr:hypothetical protein [Phycisphaeraceae bacterium]
MFKTSISYSDCSLVLGIAVVLLLLLAVVGAGFTQLGMNTIATVVGYCVGALGACLLMIAASMPLWSLMIFRSEGIVWKVYRFTGIAVLRREYRSVDRLEVRDRRAHNDSSSEWGTSDSRHVRIEVVSDGVTSTFLNPCETMLFGIDRSRAQNIAARISNEPESTSSDV